MQASEHDLRRIAVTDVTAQKRMRIVKAGLDDGGLCIVRHKQLRDAADRRKRAHMGVDPVGERLRPTRVREGEARGAEPGAAGGDNMGTFRGHGAATCLGGYRYDGFETWRACHLRARHGPAEAIAPSRAELRVCQGTLIWPSLARSVSCCSLSPVETAMTYEKCKLGAVQSQDGGWGFAVSNERGRPLFSLTYATKAEAEEAHALMAMVIPGAAVTPHP